MSRPADTTDLERAFRSLSDDAAFTEACPDADAVWAAATGEAGSDDTAAVVDHIATCGACAEAWRLARAVDEGADELGAARARRAHRAGSSRRAWIAGAVAISAAAALLVFMLARRGGDDRGDPVIYRGVDSPIESLVPDDTELPATSFELRWAPLPGQTRYDVVITTAELTIVHRADGLEGTSYTVPAARLDGIAPGTRLFWRIDATRDDGRRISSAMFAVRLR